MRTTAAAGTAVRLRKAAYAWSGGASATVAILALCVFAAAGPALAAAGGPFGVATPDAGGVLSWSGPFAGLLALSIRLQTGLHDRLTELLSGLAGGGGPPFLLIGLSFLYGILHAIGPGHGKAVVTSYLLASGEALKRGVVLALVASLLQAVSAIVIVGAARFIFSATAASISRVTDATEIASYALIALLGLALLASRARPFIAALAGAVRGALTRDPLPAPAQAVGFVCAEVSGRAPRPVGDFSNGSTTFPGGIGTISGAADTVHGVDCACVAGIRLASAWQPAGGRGAQGEAVASSGALLRQRLSAIVSIGIRPCAGALIVLVFALSQHAPVAGVLSVFAMAVGTGATVALVAVATALARGTVMGLANRNGRLSAVVSTGLQFAAALLVLVFGAVMMLGTLAADRLI